MISQQHGELTVLQIMCIDAVVDDPILVKLIVTNFHGALEPM